MLPGLSSFENLFTGAKSTLDRMEPAQRRNQQEFKEFYLASEFSNAVSEYINYGQFNYAQLTTGENNARLLQHIKEKYIALENRGDVFSGAFTSSCHRMRRPEKPEDTDAGLISHCLADRSGLFFEESSNGTDNLQFIYENMHIFKQQGVKLLFSGIVQSAAHQDMLEHYAATSKMPQALEDYLKNVDEKRLSDAPSAASGQSSFKAGYYQLIKEAQRQGIKVIALGNTTSFLAEKLGMAETISDHARSWTTKYHCREVINYALLANTYDGPLKYIVLANECRPSGNFIAGMNAVQLADMMGGVSVAVQTSDEVRHNIITDDYDGATSANFIIIRGRELSKISANPKNAELKPPQSAEDIHARIRAHFDALPAQPRASGAMAAYTPARAKSLTTPQGQGANRGKSLVPYHLHKLPYEINLKYISNGILDIAKMDAGEKVNYLIDEINQKKIALKNADEDTLKNRVNPVPQLSSGITGRALIDIVLEKNNGLFICQGANSHEGVNFILDNLARLRAQGVTSIFIGKLIYEAHQPSLDRYQQQKLPQLPSLLANYLQHTNNPLHYQIPLDNALPAATQYSHMGYMAYMALVTAASQQGIKIVALNCAANSLYNSDDHQPLHSNSRLHAQHSYAKEVINFYQLAKPEEKYLALVDNYSGIAKDNSSLSLHPYNLATELNGISIRVDKPGEAEQSVFQPNIANAFLFPDYVISRAAGAADSLYSECALNITPGEILAGRYYQP